MIEFHEVNETEVVPQAQPDWSWYDPTDPDGGPVAKIAKVAARTYARDYSDLHEADDLFQDLLVKLCQKGEGSRLLALLERGESGGLVHTNCYRLLRDQHGGQVSNLRRHKSYEAELDKFNPKVD
ncbi:hypothetical protein [Streptomyces phage phiScoe10]|nr:hypothetical protein [Streptomyces phage phiScoe10]